MLHIHNIQLPVFDALVLGQTNIVTVRKKALDDKNQTEAVVLVKWVYTFLTQ